MKQELHYLFLKTRTTGMPFVNDGKNGNTHSLNGYPRFVEICWKTIYPRLGEILTKDMFVKPTDFSMPDFFAKKTGISQDFLLSEGFDEKELIDAFMSSVRVADVIVGHNIDFDLTLLVGRLHDLWRLDDAAMLMNKIRRDTMTESADWFHKPTKDNLILYPTICELHNALFNQRKKPDSIKKTTDEINMISSCFFELQNRKIIP